MKVPRNDSASRDDAQGIGSEIPLFKLRVPPEIQRGFDDADALSIPDVAVWFRTRLYYGQLLSPFQRGDDRKFAAPYDAGFSYRVATRLRNLVGIEPEEKFVIEQMIALFQGRETFEYSPPTPRPESQVPQRHTIAGFVYLLKSPTGAYKIGRTKTPKDRLRVFEVKLPFEVEYAALIQTDDMRLLERELHLRFASKRINGEWFALDSDDVQYIQSLAQEQPNE